MKKHTRINIYGLTLIELLAVIVILAVIAIIASPIITGIIEKTRMEAFTRSVEFAISQYNFVRQTTSGVTEVDVTSDNLKLQNNKFINGTIITNEEKESKAMYVSDGRYCAIGTLGNIKVTKGECLIDSSGPSLEVEKLISSDKTKLTLRIKATDVGVGLDDMPYSFDNGLTWQTGTDLEVNSSYNGVIQVRDLVNNRSKKNYSISKITVKANSGIWNGLTENSINWLEKDETLNLPDPIKIGYAFTGWTKTGNGEINNKVFTMKTEESELTANWEQNVFTLTINPNGGIWNNTTNNTTYQKEYKSEMTIENPTRTGYTFTGWSVEEQTGSSINGTTFKMGYKNTTITANWQAIAYTITYNLNGGSASNVTSYNIETNTFTLNNPSRTNYRFIGWTGTELSSASTSVTIPKGSIGNRSYTANWVTCTGSSSYTYTGSSQYIDDGSGNYRIKLKTNGTIKFNCPGTIDVFLVGGGASGGGAGYTKTVKKINISAGTNYSIVVGAGGAVGSNGGSSSAFSNSVAGGSGCNGGSACGDSGYTSGGGTGGSNGGSTGSGTGQGSTTREFGEASGALYAGGGGGGTGWCYGSCPKTGCSFGPNTCYNGGFDGGSGGTGGGGKGQGKSDSCTNGTANTGGGAGLGVRGTTSCSGGSGIVVIRNAR